MNNFEKGLLFAKVQSALGLIVTICGILMILTGTELIRPEYLEFVKAIPLQLSSNFVMTNGDAITSGLVAMFMGLYMSDKGAENERIFIALIEEQEIKEPSKSTA